MPGGPTISVGSLQKAGTLQLSAGGMEATFVPELGLLGASVRFEGDEFLSLHGGLDAVRGGHTTGIPLLHPWANRLSEMSYESEGTRVDLNGLDLHTDANGLPIHGTMVSAAGWELTHVEQTRAAASARMRFDFGARDDLLASFPFPHEITTEITVDGALSVATTLRPTGDVNVPVAFGYHPYFRIPRVPRRSLTLRLPARQHVILDDRGIPNGESELEPAEYEKLGDRSFDDQYALGDDRRLQLESGSRRITLAQQENYPYSQIYAPPDESYVALEPMTALTNALVTQSCPLVAPGLTFAARFSVSVSDIS